MGRQWCWVRMLVMAAVVSAVACAQEPSEGWPGEWGGFQRVPKTGPIAQHFEGQELSISGCAAQRCRISLQVKGKAFHAEASGALLIENGGSAVARLMDLKGAEQCTLALEKTDGAQPAIAVTPRTGDCSYFETPGASFAHMYALRSRTPFYSELFLPDCFVGDERAQVAICASPALAAQEHDWVVLVWKVLGLGTPPLDMHSERTKLLKSCDGAADPGPCMAEAFKRSTEELQARERAWKASVTEPGDTMVAEEAIKTIAGTYRRTLPNGDVQGNHFSTTDTLKIWRASDESIHYEVQLFFFNGHECSRAGVASYRRDGAFVEQAEVDWAPAGVSRLCVFELIPTADGVQLSDPTGMCKLQSCGERGGYNGEPFKFSQRVKPSTAKP